MTTLGARRQYLQSSCSPHTLRLWVDELDARHAVRACSTREEFELTSKILSTRLLLPSIRNSFSYRYFVNSCIEGLLIFSESSNGLGYLLRDMAFQVSRNQDKLFKEHYISLQSGTYTYFIVRICLIFEVGKLVGFREHGAAILARASVDSVELNALLALEDAHVNAMALRVDFDLGAVSRGERSSRVRPTLPK